MTRDHYFDLRISFNAGTVSIVAQDSSGNRAAADLALDTLPPVPFPALATAAERQRFGTLLFECIVAGDVARLFAQAQAASGEALHLRLHLDNAPELANLPWDALSEYLHGLLVEPQRPVRDLAYGDLVQGHKIGQLIVYAGAPPAEPPPLLSFEPATVLVIAGTFEMGSPFAEDSASYDMAQHTLSLPAYRIGAQPVSNRQYQAFLKAQGLAAPRELWAGRTVFPDGAGDQPVTGMTFRESLDYCDWLSSKSQRTYTLPNEAEWEKAAGLADLLDFSWGTIGEWTCTLWGEQPQRPDPRFAYPWRDDERNDPAAGSHLRRVVRGAMQPSQQRRHAIAARNGFPPRLRSLRSYPIGFRVVRHD